MAAIITLCSCDNQDKAENLIKDFLDKNLQTSEYSVSFTELDSTRHVTDSAINAMRANAANNKLYKKGITYDNKLHTGAEAAEHRRRLEERLQAIGYTAVTARGDVRYSKMENENLKGKNI